MWPYNKIKIILLEGRDSEILRIIRSNDLGCISSIRNEASTALSHILDIYYDVIHYAKYLNISSTHTINTHLPFGEYEPDMRIIHGCFSILSDYVESNSLINKKNRNSDEDEAVELYRYWTVTRPNLSDEVDELDNQMLSRLIKLRSSLWRDYDS